MSRTAGPQHRPLRKALAERVVIADGAMGSMLQNSAATLDDFAGHEGCNEILNVTRPDIVRAVHDGYLAAGVDAISTNTFGANLANLGEYGISERIYELSLAGATIARQAADNAAADGRFRWVLGSIGPGTKLPTLGHVAFADLRDAYERNAAGLLAGGADALIVETCQDLLQAKAAIIGAKRAIKAAAEAASGGSGGSRPRASSAAAEAASGGSGGSRPRAGSAAAEAASGGSCGSRPRAGSAAEAGDILLIAQVTIEMTGAMLLGSEIGAALTALEPLGIDVIGLNCATGPAEMSEHLRYLAAHSRVPISCMPNAGLPELTANGAYYPVTPDELANAHETFVGEFGLSL
ncbi:MAG TPA: homocysteine S-methyltransferase family protein, partial [Streptosporangiaceae bacterium]